MDPKTVQIRNLGHLIHPRNTYTGPLFSSMQKCLLHFASAQAYNSYCCGVKHIWTKKCKSSRALTPCQVFFQPLSQTSIWTVSTFKSFKFLRCSMFTPILTRFEEIWGSVHQVSDSGYCENQQVSDLDCFADYQHSNFPIQKKLRSSRFLIRIIMRYSKFPIWIISRSINIPIWDNLGSTKCPI